MLRVQEIQGGSGVLQGDALQVQDRLHRGKGPGHLLGLEQKALDLKKLDLVEGDLQDPFCRGADIFYGHEHPKHSAHILRASALPRHHPANVIQLTEQLGLLLPGKGAQLPGPLLPIGGVELERVHHILKADVFLLCKAERDHTALSSTLMTGMSTRCCIRSMSSSLSKWKP